MGFSLAAGKTLLIVAALLASASSVLADALQDENLLLSMPAGFKSGYQASNGKEDIVEYVPTGETVEDWTKMVTVQVFHDAKNIDPEAFAANIADGWKSKPGVTPCCPPRAG